MDNINKKTIRKVINELDGQTFKNAGKYTKDAKKFFENRYLEIIKLLPEVKKTDTGLEVGLSGAVLAFALKEIFELKKLYTLEHPTATKLYEKSFFDKLNKNQIILEAVDLTKGTLPWKNNFFDFIFLCDVLEHLVPSDIPNVLNELNRVLKKGGKLVITTPNIASFLKRLNLLRGKNPIEFDLRLHEGATYGHIREYTMPELIEMAKNSKFKIEKKSFFMIDVQRSIFTRIENISSKIIPSLANSLSLVLKK